MRVCKIKDELRGANKPQAIVVVPVVRVVVVPVSNLAVVVVVVPAAATLTAVRPRRRACSLMLKNAVFFKIKPLSSESPQKKSVMLNLFQHLFLTIFVI